MSARRFDMVLIDVDGTLVDSAPDLANAVNATLVEMGREPFAEDRIRQWIGQGSEKLLRAAFGGELDAEVPAEVLAGAFAGFRRHYGGSVCARSRLYPEVRETLDELKGREYLLGVVTNKPAEFNTPLFAGLGIDPYFEIVLCGDSLPERKPHPMPLLHAAERFELAPERLVMVGDSVNDIEAAHAAGCTSICVSYGYNHGQDVSGAGASHTVDRFGAILDLV